MARPRSTEEKLEVARKVGADLVRQFGKKKYYSKAMINASARRQGVNADGMYWLYALYTSAATFEEIRQAANSDADYNALRIEMVHLIQSRRPAAAFDLSEADVLLDVLEIVLDWT